MAYQQQEGQGSLFPNRFKTQGDAKPDYRGSIVVGGVTYNIAGWWKPTKDNTFFLSLKVDNYAQTAPQTAPQAPQYGPQPAPQYPPQYRPQPRPVPQPAPAPAPAPTPVAPAAPAAPAPQPAPDNNGGLPF